MKVAITGSSGLAKNIKDTLEASPYQGNSIEVFPSCLLYTSPSPRD